MTDSDSYHVLLIGGSPSASSRSNALLSELSAQLTQHGLRALQLNVRDFPAEELLYGRVEHPPIADFLRQVSAAKALVFATPVYKAVYSGALKLIVDLIAPDGLAGKAVLGVATGKLAAHGVSVERAFSGLFEFFRGSRPLPTLFVADAELEVRAGGIELSGEARDKLGLALQGLTRALAQL
jgi:FMN reductase